MGWPVVINCLLKLPKGAVDIASLREGQVLDVSREGERVFPLNVPIDMCDDQHRHIAKVAVRRLIIAKGKTDLQVEVLHVFTEAEAKVFTDNFIPS